MKNYSLVIYNNLTLTKAQQISTDMLRKTFEKQTDSFRFLFTGYSKKLSKRHLPTYDNLEKNNLKCKYFNFYC